MAQRRKRLAKKESRYPKAKQTSPFKLHLWTDESMVRAMEAVKNREMGCNRAALEYGVSRTTVKDCLS